MLPPQAGFWALLSYLSEVLAPWTHSYPTSEVPKICPLPSPPRSLPDLKSPPDQPLPLPTTLPWGLVLSSWPPWPPPLFGSCLPWGGKSDLREDRRLTSEFGAFGAFSGHHSRIQTQCSLESVSHTTYTCSSQPWALSQASSQEAEIQRLPLPQGQPMSLVWPSSFYRY